MKTETKEFLELSALCATVIGAIFHLNSKLTPQPENMPQPKNQKTEFVDRADSVATDTLKDIQMVWAATQNQKKR